MPNFSRSSFSASSAAYPFAMPPRSSCIPGVVSCTVFFVGSSFTFW